MKVAKRKKREARLEPIFGGPLWQLDRLHDLLSEDHELREPADSLMEELIPPMDVIEKRDAVIIKAEIPGMNKEDIEITLSADFLKIAGERKEETEHKDAESYQAERYFGRFERTIALPATVDGDMVLAEYKDGVLTITCPKTEESKRKLIDIKID